MLDAINKERNERDLKVAMFMCRSLNNNASADLCRTVSSLPNKDESKEQSQFGKEKRRETECTYGLYYRYDNKSKEARATLSGFTLSRMLDLDLNQRFFFCPEDRDPRTIFRFATI